VPDLIPIYSISKPFLAEAVIALDVPLDSEIGQHVPGLHSCYKGRKISDLLNHTSGLDDYGDMPEYQEAVKEGKPAWGRELLLAKASGRTHNNEGFHYSNIGYLLLIMLVEEKSGKLYFEALSELVFRSLHINGFTEWKTPHPAIPDYDPNWVYSGTFLSDPKTVASSLMKLARHRHDFMGLRAGLTQLSYLETGFEEPGYGFGFMTDGGWSNSEPRFVGHGGGGPGFNLMALVNISNWKSELMYSTGDFVQSMAISELIKKIGD
jgi:D-alanyl-D-alanine carboxypeptidase